MEIDLVDEVRKTEKKLKELEDIRYIHYRELYPEITIDNYQTCTKVDFKEVKTEYENVREGWGRLKHSLGDEVIYYYKSKSGSEYFSTKNGDLYRLSNHWGATASCEWTLDGTGELRMSVMTEGPLQMGVANLRDFQIFRRRDDRRRDIVVNPEWKERIKVIIPITRILHNMMADMEFKLLMDDEKYFIGSSYGKFRNILKQNDVFIW
jgi:hypothetical protein